ncbi:MAG TPA: hypothetical protein DCY13_14180 [Verrucomicrobiales bacterium]|nr:hypothetical protein [Verrucomicrobiales bacterium]
MRLTSFPAVRRFRLTERHYAWLFLLPSIILLLFFLGWPLLQTIVFSLFDLERTTALSLERFIGLHHFGQLLASMQFWRALGFTLYLTVLAVALELVGGLLLALMSTALVGWMKGVSRCLMILPWAMPPIILAAIWKWMLNSDVGWIGDLTVGMGITDTPPLFLGEPLLAMHCVVLLQAWRGMWMAGIFLTAGMAMTPRELHAAAAVDGAGAWQRFWRITLPLLRPAIVATVLVRAVDALRAFEIVYGLTGGGPGQATEVLSSFAYRNFFSYLDYGRGAAGAVITFLVVSAVGWWHVRRMAGHVHNTLR